MRSHVLVCATPSSDGGFALEGQAWRVVNRVLSGPLPPGTFHTDVLGAIYFRVVIAILSPTFDGIG